MQCLESIAGQTHRDLQILCLDDGSTDDTLAILQRFAEHDSRVAVISKVNEGYGATCNRGLDAALGDWIAIVEPDDWIEPGMYERMLAFGATLPTTPDVIKTPYWRIVNPDTPRQQQINCSYRHRIKPPAQPFRVAEAPHLLDHHPSIWSALYRRDFLEAHHIRFKPIPGAGWADNPFLVETLCRAEALAYIDEPFYCYREDTPEKASAFIRTNTLVLFERWMEQRDILDRLDITDPRILRTQNHRGFTYLDMVLKEVDLKDSTPLMTAVRIMFARMDKGLVLNDPSIKPELKQLFITLRDLPPQQVGKTPYWLHLVKEGFYSLHNLGLRNTLRFALRFFANS
jgi:glycosyltransferase involved in cell wall biosynthesis